jgi:Flp pilus assembly pilin Flp
VSERLGQGELGKLRALIEQERGADALEYLLVVGVVVVMVVGAFATLGTPNLVAQVFAGVCQAASNLLPSLSCT